MPNRIPWKDQTCDHLRPENTGETVQAKAQDRCCGQADGQPHDHRKGSVQQVVFGHQGVHRQVGNNLRVRAPEGQNRRIVREEWESESAV